MAYKEWLRVLKKGGKLLNFDANWYGYLYDDKKREAYENDRKNVEKEAWMIIICAQILTEWRKLRCRFHCLRPSVRDGM
mgnify:CR=1 FL=1